MKIFSYEKFKKAEKDDVTWARESDGHIVWGGQILGTKYRCIGACVDALLEYARGWNDCCDYIRDKLEHLPKEANEEC